MLLGLNSFCSTPFFVPAGVRRQLLLVVRGKRVHRTYRSLRLYAQRMPNNSIQRTRCARR